MLRYILAFLLLQSTMGLLASQIVIDGAKSSRKFDGIGGISGGGATSLLLQAYEDERRAEIFDYLFKPNFGASLQIVKVEIGSDAQSTDGTEACYSRSSSDVSWTRGYEWAILAEAKARNPAITTVGLPWGFPAWVGNNTGDPYAFPEQTAHWVADWCKGARDVHGIGIDYVGIWNERPFNATYIKVLRQILDEKSPETRIVAADGNFGEIVSAMDADKELKDAIDVVGAHYPGTFSSPAAVALEKPLWASEDYSTYSDWVGAGCWARLLNQNHVNGNMTATISWNLVAAYYPSLPFEGDGLMRAMSPWSGNYDVSGPIWISAHHTQFCKPGWHYLNSGKLPKGGSFVSLSDGEELTIVIETMKHDSSVCIRPKLPHYTVESDDITFTIDGFDIDSMQLWTSHVAKDSDYFYRGDDVQLVDGKFTFHVDPDHVHTISTVTTARKGSHPPPPASAPFPLPYYDDFSRYDTGHEADLFADQTGAWEITSNHTMRQAVIDRPIAWCKEAKYPITLIGDANWRDIMIKADVLVESADDMVGLGVRIGHGGCNMDKAKGLFFWLDPTNGMFYISLDLNREEIIHKGPVAGISVGTWITMELRAKGMTVDGMVNGQLLFSTRDVFIRRDGLTGVVSTWGYTQFAKFSLVYPPASS